MHELAHIALHVDDTETWYIDNLDVRGADEIEQEADALAQESLIPSASWNLAKITDATGVRYELKSHSKFGKAFRDKVRTLLK